jgi:hypothetical protein
MLKGAGAELDDETFAYHLQHLVAHIHKFMDKKRVVTGPNDN